MTTRLVCDRWPLEVGEQSGGHFKWMNTHGSRHNADAFLEVIQGLPKGMSVVEFFGGIGEFATVIRNVLEPREHRIFDLDPECAEHLQRTIPEATVAPGDAKINMKLYTAEFVVCDLPYHTAPRMQEWPWENVFTPRPRAVVISDTARWRVHLPTHQKYYSKFFGEPIVTFSDYLRCYDQLFINRYQYHIACVASRKHSWLLLEAL